MDRWQSWEYEVAKTLDLDTTIASGSKFHDSGDATTRGRDNPFPLWCDAKFTERGSFSLNSRTLRQYKQRADEQGKRFVLPLRFWLPQRTDDYAVLSFHDFVELRNRGT